MELFSAVFTLFLIMDPLGNIPVFLSVLKDVPPERRRAILVRELLIALAVVLVFLFFGPFLLSLASIKQTSLSIAGGIVLLIISMHMIFPPAQQDGFSANPGGEPFIVPLAVPLVAGPSTISMVMILAGREPANLGLLTVAVVTAWLVNSLILFLYEPVGRLLGKRGLMAMERLMGMILVTVAVQMLLEGVQAYLKK